jgi:formate/nitrite transporter FocA (FNT family)
MDPRGLFAVRGRELEGRDEPCRGRRLGGAEREAVRVASQARRRSWIRPILRDHDERDRRARPVHGSGHRCPFRAPGFGRDRAAAVSDRPTSGSSGDLTSTAGAREEPQVEDAFDRLVSEGRDRLSRPLLPLLTTAFVGGVDVGIGVLIYLVVKAQTGSGLLAALAFTTGFVALLLARSELFTENFLVPVTAVVAREGTVTQLVRLWVLSLAANLVGGFLMAAMIVVGLPGLRTAAVATGSHYAHLGVSWESFFLAVLAGAVITLLTRMQHATDNLGVQLVPAVLLSFVLVGAELFHSVLDSIFMFAGLLTGHSDYGYADWLGALGWSTLGNLVGGLVLVTAVRLLRVPHRVQEERAQGPHR